VCKERRGMKGSEEVRRKYWKVEEFVLSM